MEESIETKYALQTNRSIHPHIRIQHLQISLPQKPIGKTKQNKIKLDIISNSPFVLHTLHYILTYSTTKTIFKSMNFSISIYYLESTV